MYHKRELRQSLSRTFFWELLGLRMFKSDRLLSIGVWQIPLDNGHLSTILESLFLVFL
jgi:hypothetical protein